MDNKEDKITNIHKFFDILSKQSGLLGVYSNPGFGLTTFALQTVAEINNRKEGFALYFSLTNAENQLKQKIKELNLLEKRIFVYDDALLSLEKFENTIKNINKISVVCVDYLWLLDFEVASNLYNVAKKYKIPILVMATLPRDSGDYSPDCRPELYSIHDFRSCAGTNYLKTNQWNKFENYETLVFLHRKHKCVRNVGTVYRYDINNKVELIVKKCRGYAPANLYALWDKTANKFKF